MIIDWFKFAPALLLLLVPAGLFHGRKVRYRAISRDWDDHWPLILTLGFHWIDLVRAALGGWLLVMALTQEPGMHGLARYAVLLTQGSTMILAVALQTFVCKELDSALAPFTFVAGLLFGVFPPAIAGFPVVLATAVASGAGAPLAFFPVLAVALMGIGFWFGGKGMVIKLVFGFCAIALPWLCAIAFRRELIIAYRAKRREDAP